MPSTVDTVRMNETPEGVDLGLRVAGPVPRAYALALDGLIRAALYLLLTPLLSLASLGVGLFLLGIFLVDWLYPVAFEVYRGATPGKRAMGLAVVHDDGTPVGLAASLIRNLLRIVDFLPLFYGVGLVSSLIDRDFRRLGDLAAGTLTIHAEARAAKPRTPSASPRRPPQGLALAVQQAILAFAERSERLSPARRVELAETLVARLDPAGPARGQAAVDLVRGYASWLAGGR